ncbi:BQ5605_C043g12060 [Microbotryum silenes-dioicae]|uniref:BQ5605_C011g06679 protein n=1 Tax=Microbotryum silenes-dioicae TaxID=796604 RepID=A0A2X0NTQ3_9BASI|nr:BQ5605_C011g06679 [Microbotryum silenes-dioicae]SGZ31500.1 BQ5605_C045g12185 [Microbotryum silenes-dioicae]SGZ32046.1 BQ5605_C043g12060 [Microbotryum silenes-dioicae]
MSHVASRIILTGFAASLFFGYQPLKHGLDTHTKSSVASGYILSLTTMLAIVFAFAGPTHVALQFCWNCFFKPLGKSKDQEGRLYAFYSGQADIYDKTRNALLRGRRTMLKLSAAHLREQRKSDPCKRLIWLDIGGGTGWNVEEMDKLGSFDHVVYFSITDFDAVYVLDLCEPLLTVSRKRFEARGWKNVHCLLQDATAFVLPGWEDGAAPEGALDFVTMSYSLSMMPNMLALIDRVDRFLSPSGLLSVCDFYVSAREKSSLAEIIGDVASRQCSWLTRLFWLHWFEFDHVDLHPSRRQYLEHCFATIKSFNGRNHFVLPWIVRIPYYVNLMTSRRADTSRANVAYKVDAGNTISASASPLLVAARQSNVDLPALNIGLAALSRRNSSPQQLCRSKSQASATTRIDVSPVEQLSSFHYGKRQFRMPYLDSPVHKEFRTWIYGFTVSASSCLPLAPQAVAEDRLRFVLILQWEDPAVDMKYLKPTKDDSILCITSAGDNALHYAIAGEPGQQPRRIHAVDMNPCQGHLLELKLASICALDYEDHWKAKGTHPQFRELLDTKLSPFLTSHAYQFWRKNDRAFASSFYLRGYSGWALRLAKVALKIGGLSKEVDAFVSATTQAEQKKIWEDKFRPVLLSKLITKLFLSNSAFLWNALEQVFRPTKLKCSYPRQQPNSLQSILSTLWPTAPTSHQERTITSPEYLTRAGFEALNKDNGARLDSFRLHTDSIINVRTRMCRVMKRLGSNSLTIAIIMDLQDWFRNSLGDSDETVRSNPCDLTLTIRALRNALAPGGRVFWRSAGLEPWYIALYKREGFRVDCIHQREIGSKTPIDRVNMYASFYVAYKL